ncbi:MAG: DUF4397 domain-containing protein [Myxococcales bacterium]|nr:DUF4397 domain-containing protein [Myxococcales bacterium]
MKTTGILPTFTTVCALLLAACSDVSPPVDAGTGGAGGAGGDAAGARVRFAHLAPEIPSASDTKIDIRIDGDNVVEDIEFGEATAFFDLPSGEYTVSIAAAAIASYEFSALVAPADVLTVVVYRTVANQAEDPVGALLFDGSTAGLLAGNGRILIGHGANEPLLNPLNVLATDNLATDNCPPPVIEDLFFGEVSMPIDINAASVEVALNLTSSPECRADAAFTTTIIGDTVTIWVGVDNDTTEEAIDPTIYSISGDFSGGPIPTLDSVR